MNTYYVIAQVKDTNYLVKVKAESLLSAERCILDMGYTGKHTYGVTASMAFDKKSMKTDTFIYNALEAEPITGEELTKIIELRNEEIRKVDEKENRINELKRDIKTMTEELDRLLNE